jgi:uncharacterized protein
LEIVPRRIWRCARRCAATAVAAHRREHAIDEVRNEPRWIEARNGSINLCQKCRQCKFMNACGGGYLPHRFSRKNGYDNPSVYCDDLYAMFEYMQSVLESHLYVSGAGGERRHVRDALART